MNEFGRRRLFPQISQKDTEGTSETESATDRFGARHP